MDFDREVSKYVVEFDINPGQTAKIKPQYLKVTAATPAEMAVAFTDDVVEQAKRAQSPAACAQEKGLVHARAAGARSPASVYEANKARSGL